MRAADDTRRCGRVESPPSSSSSRRRAAARGGRPRGLARVLAGRAVGVGRAATRCAAPRPCAAARGGRGGRLAGGVAVAVAGRRGRGSASARAPACGGAGGRRRRRRRRRGAAGAAARRRRRPRRRRRRRGGRGGARRARPGTRRAAARRRARAAARRPASRRDARAGPAGATAPGGVAPTLAYSAAVGLLLRGGRRRGLQRLGDDAALRVGLDALRELGGALGLAAGPLAQALDLARLGEVQQRQDGQPERSHARPA